MGIEQIAPIMLLKSTQHSAPTDPCVKFQKKSFLAHVIALPNFFFFEVLSELLCSSLFAVSV